MCKLLIIAGLDPKKQDLNWKFVQTMGDLMTPGNGDGLGYTAVGEDNKIFGERWLFNEEAFRQRKERFTRPRKIDKDKTKAFRDRVGDIAELEDEVELLPIEKYGNFGDLNPNIAAITLHTRAASGTVCYRNIHPFVDYEESVSVIHNGYIRNHTKEDEKRSTCDSERILNMYLEHEINKGPADMQNFVDDIKGWFACGIFSLDRDGKRVLDIFRTGAGLSAAYVKELNTVVFSTSYEDIKKACRKLGLTIQSKAEKTKEHTLLRLDAMTGEKILSTKYNDTTDKFEHWNQQYFNRSGDEGGRHGGATGTAPNKTESTYQPTDWEKKAREKRELEATKAAGEKKQTALTVVTEATIQGNTATNLSEGEKQELVEMERTGVLTGAEILQAEKDMKVKNIMNRGWDKEEAIAYVEKLYNQKADDEVVLAANDPKEKAITNVINNLEKSVTNDDGWFQAKGSNVWIKKAIKQ